MAVPTLNPEEYQFEDTGVKLNADVALPFVDLQSVQGLDSPTVRTHTTAREGTHGGWVEAEYEDVRTITLEGMVYASPTNLETYLDSLKKNYAPSKTVKPFYFGVDSTDDIRMVFAKSLGLKYSKDSARRTGKAEIQIQLLCEDPRIYATVVTSQNLPGTLVLGGNRDSSGTITINAPRTNPTITIGGTTFAFAYNLTSGSIVIDLDKRTVIRNGTINARNLMTLTGPWPKLQPGNNAFTVGGTGTGTITAAARSAWR